MAARERHGAARIALLLGTSTSSIGATEDAYRELDAEGRFPAGNRNPRVHTPHSLTLFVQEALGIEGPSLTISTACSSSAKVFAAAERMLRLGLVDAAIVGGVDTLCGSVLFGFNALQLVSSACRAGRSTRIATASASARRPVSRLLERSDAPPADADAGADADFDADADADPSGGASLSLLGYGESSDAHHMSSPHPEGLGAERALDDALARAGVAAEAIDHINLHGTASQKNDEVEAALVARRFPARTHASSTKGITGHTLGAAGIVEAAASLLAIENGFMPGNVNAVSLDTRGAGRRSASRRPQADVRLVLSNSFGFGGSNCVLVFGRGLGMTDGQTRR